MTKLEFDMHALAIRIEKGTITNKRASAKLLAYATRLHTYYIPDPDVPGGNPEDPRDPEAPEGYYSGGHRSSGRPI